MQLSLHADYACRTLIFLALLSSEEKSSIEDIARAYDISTNHLVKVVHNLGKQGFIETIRGRGGGLRLARPARDILIGEVIRKMEPSFALVECLKVVGNTCPITDNCGLQPWLGKAMKAFFDVLDQLTLEEVAQSRSGLTQALGVSAG